MLADYSWWYQMIYLSIDMNCKQKLCMGMNLCERLCVHNWSYSSSFGQQIFSHLKWQTIGLWTSSLYSLVSICAIDNASSTQYMIFCAVICWCVPVWIWSLQGICRDTAGLCKNSIWCFYSNIDSLHLSVRRNNSLTSSKRISSSFSPINKNHYTGGVIKLCVSLKCWFVFK